MSDLSRRQMLGAAAVVASGLAAGGSRAEEAEAKEELPNFRYALEKEKGRITEGGSAKEATVKQLPISTGLAGVSMRLKPADCANCTGTPTPPNGPLSLRAAFAPLLSGRTGFRRPTISTLVMSGTSSRSRPCGPEPDPRGSPLHSGFDDGGFSEYRTFSVTDWLAQRRPRCWPRRSACRRRNSPSFPRRNCSPCKDVCRRTAGAGSPKAVATSPLTHRFPLMAQPQRSRGEERRRVRKSSRYQRLSTE